MKIEIGESLVYSWLRHIKCCQIVQTNWKASSTWAKQSTVDWGKKYEKFVEQYKISNSSKLDQLIKQTECDAVGISMGTEKKVYAVEVAFHEGGLGYGDAIENASKIMVKFFRIAVCLNVFLGCTEAEIIFASPVIHEPTLSEIKKYQIEKYINEQELKFSFSIIANKDFEEEILNKLLSRSNDIKDGNELFVRSYNLLHLFYKQWTPSCQISDSTYLEMKVGQLAKNIMRDAIENNRVSPKEIRDMLDISWSKNTFGISFPVLAKDGSDFENNRYYVKPIEIDKAKYYLCSQWVEENKEKLLTWIKDHEKTIGDDKQSTSAKKELISVD